LIPCLIFNERGKIPPCLRGSAEKVVLSNHIFRQKEHISPLAASSGQHSAWYNFGDKDHATLEIEVIFQSLMLGQDSRKELELQPTVDHRLCLPFVAMRDFPSVPLLTFGLMIRASYHHGALTSKGDREESDENLGKCQEGRSSAWAPLPVRIVYSYSA